MEMKQITNYLDDRKYNVYIKILNKLHAKKIYYELKDRKYRWITYDDINPEMEDLTIKRINIREGKKISMCSRNCDTCERRELCTVSTYKEIKIRKE
jgi:hypothetical protein